MNKAAVYCKSCFFVLHRPSPRCNLGYVVVISLAHCHSHQCCFCRVVTFCSFSLLLSSLPFIHPSVDLSLEPKRLAERVSSQLEEIGELLCSVRPVRTVAVGQEMSSTEETPAADTYPRKILEYMEGFLISKTLFTACELGVFDVLLDAERPLSAEEISQAVEASLDGTQRLLDACTGLQLLRAHQDNGQVFYSNSEQAKVYLTRSSPVSLFQSIQYSSRTIYLCWHYLTDAVREGRNQYEKAFGVSSEDLFQALYRSDDEMMKFMQLMNSIWNICGRDVVTAFDLSPFKGFCDLGGCSGALAKQCTSAYPECTVTIFDLDKVVRMSREHFVSEANQRISFYEGDFFKDPLPEADLYILARILHDWSDGRCIELLRRVYEACKPGGAVLLVEALLHEDGSGPLTVQLYSLNMLVQTEGCERTAAQYAALLTAAGFTNIQHRLTGKIYDAVLAHKET